MSYDRLITAISFEATPRQPTVHHRHPKGIPAPRYADLRPFEIANRVDIDRFTRIDLNRARSASMLKSPRAPLSPRNSVSRSKYLTPKGRRGRKYLALPGEDCYPADCDRLAQGEQVALRYLRHIRKEDLRSTYRILACNGRLRRSKPQASALPFGRCPPPSPLPAVSRRGRAAVLRLPRCV